jgi:hypothetical protein
MWSGGQLVTHSTRHMGWPKTQNEAQKTMLPSVSALSLLRSTSVSVISGTCGVREHGEQGGGGT